MVTTMALYRSQIVAFAQYATAQVTYHQRVITLHEVDGTDCCRHCGRVWPCDQLRNSRRMVDHFSQWALAEEDPPGPDLARRYVNPGTGN